MGGVPRSTRYRDGVPLLETLAQPRIRVQRDRGVLELARARFASAFQLDPVLGLSAVIEEHDGTLSYWALRHAPGKPDFHHRDAFALELGVKFGIDRLLEEPGAAQAARRPARRAARAPGVGDARPGALARRARRRRA